MRLLPHEALEHRGIPYSKSQLRRMEDRGEFPRRVPLGAHRYAYAEHEVDAYLRERLAARDEMVAA